MLTYEIGMKTQMIFQSARDFAKAQSFILEK